MGLSGDEIRGLSDEEIILYRNQYGSNIQRFKKNDGLTDSLKALLKEPMFLLLLIASIIYFVIGHINDGIFMVAAIMLVSAISLYQDTRSRNAIAALKLLTQPHCKVIRNRQTISINSEDIVMNDLMVIEEGSWVPADGIIVQSNDFSVNESILTGESLQVYKSAGDDDHYVYQGTSVSGGLAICRVTGIGNATKLGQIGKRLESIAAEQTPLQQQIGHFVKRMAIAGVIIFIIVWLINYLLSKNLLDSLLKSLTLAMSILPEEIPVAFTTFMALGAWRLMKMGLIVKQTKTVESLGSATVICVDKTGTITENSMKLEAIFDIDGDMVSDANGVLNESEKALIRTAMWASEPIPFDPMEKALHEKYQSVFDVDERKGYRMIHEYPLSGKPPMMTHIFENEFGQRIIAAKGSPEAFLKLQCLTETAEQKLRAALKMLTGKGYRVLAVATSVQHDMPFPAVQQDFKFICKGLIAFYDPPKENIRQVLKAFDHAGIAVKIITGDNEATTRTIASQIHFKNAAKSLDGDAVQNMSEAALQACVGEVNIFTRMFPEAKLRVINALKAKGEIVAMTGDGVNDGPALKSAHIGIAMGKKGSEIAKQASSLILVDDDLMNMVDAIAMGRKIYSNLKKAIQYIISIHIPIILTVFIPLVLGWVYPNLFTPVHVIFLELIMGPTCSIIYENEPIEKNIMSLKPRVISKNFFSVRELTTSLIQGLVITAGTVFVYQYASQTGSSESVTRTMVFLTLISANIFLTLVNRSFYYSIVTTGTYRNYLVPLIISITILLMAVLLFVSPVSNIFQFSRLDQKQLLISTSVGFLSVIWYEGIKYLKRLGVMDV